MRIIGVDPGTKVTGVGIIDVNDGGDFSPVFFAPLKFKDNLDNVIFQFFTQLKDIVEEYKPDIAVIEDIFYAVNIKSTIMLAHLRGSAITLFKLNNMPVYSYTPLDVKKTIAGYGRAEKEQVKFLVEHLLNIDLNGYPLDVSDALALAICHANYAMFG
ncbi:crossover junction endodeoxyribonuclease RuvC [Thermotomaculum hydrothermale]|uniref:Crossover junction endodeoxyribonuclease RuvC n=1 Tax=Thermotomaculum hydrothermale TaxID=981385 RepID=A0A7R6PPL8_9BACT|nr:crossover junction endodeoxyribonuclease RuvC [Thermotomaculum hydrothermale]BBB32036.1 crossover junction endodeoxyribonuclease RuvC [Thermotomaculum hydrothermale]